MVILLLTYAAVLVFLVVVISRFIRIAGTPVHLRWELYPLPQEKGRASYGGSRLEEVDWWNKKEEKSLFDEVKYMATEIAFLKGIWEHNRKLWTGSYPFHFGLYIFIVNIFLLILAVILEMSGVRNPFFWDYYRNIVVVLAWAGSIIGMFGTIKLYISRATDKGLALYSTPSHYFNIMLIGSLYLTMFIWLLSDKFFFGHLFAYYYSMFFFINNNATGALAGQMLARLPVIAYINIILSLLFIAYLPFTHMTHFFTKFFTYHKVRWNDEANKPGSNMADKIAAQLEQKVTWAAPHIGAGGNKTWIALATEDIYKEKDNA